MSRFLLLAAAMVVPAFAGCLDPALVPASTNDLPTTAAGVVSSFTDLVCDPACNVRLSHDAGPANELGLAMDPNDPKRLLAGAKDYNEQYTDCVTVSWFFSEDGGRSWTEGYYHPPRDPATPSPPGAPKMDAQSCESDPVPVFDGHGNALMSTLAYGGTEPAVGLPTYRLTKGATEWEPVAHAYEGDTDKQWADVDAETGDVYVVTRDFQGPNVEVLVRSTDGGLSWDKVAGFDSFDFAQVAIGPGGAIHLAGLGTADDGQGSTVVIVSSHDRGLTWTEPFAVAKVDILAGSFVGGTKGYRTPMMPAVAAADRTDRVVVAYFDDTGLGWDVFVRVSHDAGKTWDDPVRVSDDELADQWTPAVGLSPSGNVHVTFFDARHDPTGQGRLVDLYYAHSADGKAFDPNLRISDQSFVPYLSRHQDTPFFIGDYNGIVATDQEAVMVWPDTRHDRADVYAAIVGG